MDRHLAVSALLLSGLLVPAAAQQATSGSTATCMFQDGKEMSIQYDSSASVKNANLSSGKMWTPGDKPMVLFTQADLTIANTQIPAGAYSVHLIPAKDRWTLVINKNVKPGGIQAATGRSPCTDGRSENQRGAAVQHCLCAHGAQAVQHTHLRRQDRDLGGVS